MDGWFKYVLALWVLSFFVLPALRYAARRLPEGRFKKLLRPWLIR